MKEESTGILKSTKLTNDETPPPPCNIHVYVLLGAAQYKHKAGRV